MIKHAVYDTTTGAISHSLSAPTVADITAQLRAGEASIEVAPNAVVSELKVNTITSTLEQRTSQAVAITPDIIPADQAAAVTLTGFVPGSHLQITSPEENGEPVVIYLHEHPDTPQAGIPLAPPFPISVDMAGEYTVRILHPLYLPTEVTFNATAPI